MANAFGPAPGADFRRVDVPVALKVDRDEELRLRSGGSGAELQNRPRERELVRAVCGRLTTRYAEARAGDIGRASVLRKEQGTDEEQR